MFCPSLETTTDQCARRFEGVFPCSLRVCSQGRAAYVAQAAGTATCRGDMGHVPNSSHFMMSRNLKPPYGSKLQRFFFSLRIIILISDTFAPILYNLKDTHQQGRQGRQRELGEDRQGELWCWCLEEEELCVPGVCRLWGQDGRRCWLCQCPTMQLPYSFNGCAVWQRIKLCRQCESVLQHQCRALQRGRMLHAT